VKTRDIEERLCDGIKKISRKYHEKLKKHLQFRKIYVIMLIDIYKKFNIVKI
jgi:hypothetical protein